MKAVVLRSFGTPDKLSVEDIASPTPGSGQVLIKVMSASVNYADIVRRRNDPYPVPTHLPAVLGGEVAGFIEALGEDVTSTGVGAPVFALMGNGGLGGYAQYAVADITRVIPLPTDFDLDIACTLVVAGVTAYQILKEAGRLEAGDSVFIPGAAGGVGTYAVQLAKIFGAGAIIAGASTPERREAALDRGATHTVDYTKADWPDEVKRLTGGRGADVVLDMAGGKGFDQSLAALAPFGRLVVYGTASRERSTLVPQQLLGLAQTVTGYYVAQWFADRPKQSLDAFAELVALITAGRLDAGVAERLPLASASAAHATMEGRRAQGKIVLKPWADA